MKLEKFYKEFGIRKVDFASVMYRDISPESIKEAKSLDDLEDELEEFSLEHTKPINMDDATEISRFEVVWPKQNPIHEVVSFSGLKELMVFVQTGDFDELLEKSGYEYW